MKNLVTYAAGVLVVVVFNGLLSLQTAHSSEPPNKNSRAEQPAAVEALPVPQAQGHPLQPCHAVRVRPDGSLLGRVGFIDAHSLQLLPVPEATVRFVQSGKTVAQLRSNAQGEFVVQGLTARAVYSVLATSEGGYSAFSIAVVEAGAKLTSELNASREEQAVESDDDETSPQSINNRDGSSEITHRDNLLVALDDGAAQENAEDENEEGTEPADSLQITLVPIGDGQVPLPPFGIGPVTTGGGGGGGGGGGLFLPIVIPFSDNDRLASPFIPE